MTTRPPPRPSNGSTEPTLTFDDWDEPPIPAPELSELFQALEKGARAHRLYQENNPVYRSFQAMLRGAYAKLWDRVSSLAVTIDEHAFRCYGHSFSVGDGRDDLPFLFYKDGIRLITFLPGFEDESERFLGVLNQARQLDHKAIDDMVTLLWEQEFAAFQYSYVDLLAQGLQLPQAGDLTVDQVDPAVLRAEIESKLDEVFPSAVEAGEPPVALAVQPENFVETLYFLEPHELEKLNREVELEWARDTKTAVLDALFDRLEDPNPDRQLEIVRILRQLMPIYLSGGDVASAARILVDLTALIDARFLGGRELAEAEDLFRELSEPTVLAQLLASLSDGSINPTESDLTVFLSHLGSGALPLLISAAESTDAAQLKQRLRISIEGLAQEHGDVLIGLIDSADQYVALGATRLTGQLGLGVAAPRIALLLKRPEVSLRRVAAEALVKIRSGAALAAVQEALVDDDRDVRITVARGLGAVHYLPARPRLEEAIQSKWLSESDLTEQIAFFEAYGSLATPDSVKLLDRLLNGRKLFGKQSAEIRACAAMALGKVDSPAAKTCLAQASNDPHPMVRNAVAKALGREPVVQ